MNKKFLSVLVSVFFLLNTAGLTFADKKDVADPALQAIITELSSRMPRFINKYGSAVFVADEQITRGALLQALYEFDKKSSSSSSSASAAGVISKKEYDALNAKVAALEKKLGSASKSGGSSSGESADIVEIMNDLEVNLPTMLDNTLSSSKVFKNLEAQVKANAAGGGSSSSAGSSTGVSVAVVNSLQKNISDLSKKVTTVETNLAKKADSSKTDLSINAIKDLQKNISDLNSKVSSVESSLAKKPDSKATATELTAIKKSVWNPH